VRPVLIVKTGETVPGVRARRGDFEDWIAAGLGAGADVVRVVRVDAGGALPDPALHAGVGGSGSGARVCHRVPWGVAAGRWLAQHDPDVLPSGNILLYDNLGNFGEGGRSRILEVDPRSGAEVWSYTGNPEQTFESDARGAQERLPNGNTLISETAGGRIFEVTPDRRIVWEFLNPERAEDPETPGQKIVPIVSWGQRIPYDYLVTDFRTTLAAREQNGGLDE